MDIGIFRPGHRVRTSDGRQAEVLELMPDEVSVRLIYLDEEGGPFGVTRRTGEEEVVGGEHIQALLGAVASSTWREEVVVVLHYVPESEEGPPEYRAETLFGVPNDVVVSGGSSESAQEALNHLLGGLALMGFRGTVSIEDGAGERFERYRINVFPLTRDNLQ